MKQCGANSWRRNKQLVIGVQEPFQPRGVLGGELFYRNDFFFSWKARPGGFLRRVGCRTTAYCVRLPGARPYSDVVR